jgi:hypothetical protein
MTEDTYGTDTTGTSAPRRNEKIEDRNETTLGSHWRNRPAHSTQMIGDQEP